MGAFARQTSTKKKQMLRDASPESMIYTVESSSLFSSASASVDRCSFASDAHDRDSLVSDTSLQLSGCDAEKHESLSGSSVHISRVSSNKAIGNKAEFECPNQNLDSARNSFSLALKECQDRRRSRSDVLSKKLDYRRRPVSLDLNNVAALSPRFGIKKSSVMSHRVCASQSPGTPTCVYSMQKGWSSERVPLHINAARRPVNMGLVAFNGGRTLPSKWEDAERWICTPSVSGDAAFRASVALPQRRPKSKSGPLGPPDAACCSLHSPAVPMFDGVGGMSFMENSPFSAGVIAGDDGLSIQSCGNAGAVPLPIDSFMARSVSVHGCSGIPNASALPSKAERFDGVKDAATNVSPDISRRDMATQMSPEESTHSSSSKTSLSFSTSTAPALPIGELRIQGPKSEVRDVQVDERVTVSRWSKKNKIRIPKRGSGVRERKGDSSASAWDVSEATKTVSKAKREEAKITAWENLQKAKTEAAIRKLEMKLENKRSSSMDKIMNKLRLAQKRAQKMRSVVLASQADQVSGTSHKAVSFRRTRQMISLSGCFTCHAF